MLARRMPFRPTPLLAAGVLVGAGVLVTIACNNTQDEQFGGLGQLCFEGPGGALTCDPGLTCVPIPLDGGGTDGGQCFDLDVGDGAMSADDAMEDALADDAGGEADAGGEGDSAFDSDAPGDAAAE